jgi:hypothetical protein
VPSHRRGDERGAGLMRPEAKSFKDSGGRELTFLFDIEGIIAAENAADTKFAKIVKGAIDGRVGHLRALIFGGLSGPQPGITLAECGAMIESEGEALGKALWPALFSAMPERKEDKADPPKPGRAKTSGTGSRSSARGSRKG